MTSRQLELSIPGLRTGFRLHRFEVYNWGTFHDQVWKLTPAGETSLLTGDIGSGKSTLVDALTTLLVPPQRVSYNKAAGAEARERTPLSYVLGHYKSERGTSGLASRPVALRDHNNYSVILGHFRNEGFDQEVTLAQVFWLRDSQNQPVRWYILADRPLETAEHFANFGTDMAGLRKRLRKSDGVELWDSFPSYGAAFRRRFGIETEQAMELFSQTVSMKSIGNLTEFVRNHMLEAFPVEPRLQALIGHFDDLTRAHEAILKAKAQIEVLRPLISDSDRYDARVQKGKELRSSRDALQPWFASLKLALVDQRLEKLDKVLSNLDHQIGGLQQQRSEQHAHRDELKSAIGQNGGDRLERLKTDIKRCMEQKHARKTAADLYKGFSRGLGLPDASDAGTFESNRRALDSERQTAEEGTAEFQNQITEAGVELRSLRAQHEEIEDELRSLRARRSNIPLRVLTIRARLSDSLTLSEDEFPFAGELIQVREEERDWEGVAERLLHSFGLSMLVPDEHYSRVADWVNRTHLGARLVYFRVHEVRPVDLSGLHPHSLVHKLSVHSDCGVHYDWLEAQLLKRFDFACCSDQESFRRERRAATQSGQIKSPDGRHEKDDRHRIEDRSRYILGWTNEAKIAALELQANSLAKQMQGIAEKIVGWQKQYADLQKRFEDVARLEVFTDFRNLDWRPLAIEIDQLEQERNELEAASDVLATLQMQLHELENDIQVTDKTLEEAIREHGKQVDRQNVLASLRDESQRSLDQTPTETRETCFPLLATLREEAFENQAFTIESSDKREREMREWLQVRIDAENKQINTLRDRIISSMQMYCNTWALETREVDVSIVAVDEFRAMLAQLESDDLPRFEARFKELLNENTIREVANFQAQLHRERQAIRDRIETINGSLRAIDYNPGRYITLLAEHAQDVEIRDFQQELRACTEGTLTGSEDAQYSEQKFLEVKQIIERFRGREGTAEADRRWTRKVTDVRNWFVFSASERWREDDGEYEHYSDSGGKSGGQKEKLAYTVLAASLAYQFGLEFGEKTSRSFRFVCIDEAFGRGSDESARYGLELFSRLNLQLLVVTPLQKIHVIEPFVSSVGFVHNLEGRQSMLRSLTIEEYQAQKASREEVDPD